MTEIFFSGLSDFRASTANARRRRTKKASGKRNQGYTLVETLIASAITALVMGHVVLALVSTQRLLEATLADAHLSLQSRALREKLLFRINEDGGLMNANQSELDIKNKVTGNGANKGWGNGIEFKPHKGKKNRIMLGSNKKLKADIQNGEWLASGAIELQSPDVFYNPTSNKTIQVNLDLVLPMGSRRYYQKHKLKTQIINE